MRTTKENHMNTDKAVLQVGDRFFAALSGVDPEGLERVVADDCLLVDVMTGSEVPRRDLVGSRRLVFESIERLGTRCRLYGGAAVVTGQTRMIRRFDTQDFQVHSRIRTVRSRSDRLSPRQRAGNAHPAIVGRVSHECEGPIRFRAPEADNARAGPAQNAQ
jgi:hypothetical protein